MKLIPADVDAARAIWMEALAPARMTVLGMPQAPAKRRTSTLNYEEQKAAFEAAEAKRQVRQMRNLINAGLSGEELL